MSWYCIAHLIMIIKLEVDLFIFLLSHALGALTVVNIKIILHSKHTLMVLPELCLVSAIFIFKTITLNTEHINGVVQYSLK